VSNLTKENKGSATWYLGEMDEAEPVAAADGRESWFLGNFTAHSAAAAAELSR